MVADNVVGELTREGEKKGPRSVQSPLHGVNRVWKKAGNRVRSWRASQKESQLFVPKREEEKEGESFFSPKPNEKVKGPTVTTLVDIKRAGGNPPKTTLDLEIWRFGSSLSRKICIRLAAHRGRRALIVRFKGLESLVQNSDSTWTKR